MASTTHTRPFRIGLTGGVASGKSAAADCFRALGITVIDADEVAAALLEPGEPLLERVVNEFGAALLSADGSLDRAALRKRVFADPEDRRRLEALTHPAILARLSELVAAAPGPYVVLEIPLLVETGAGERVDRTLVIDCAPAEQLARLMSRDGIDEALARQMLAAQASREQRGEAADDLVRNLGSLDDLCRMIVGLDGLYRRLAGARVPAA